MKEKAKDWLNLAERDLRIAKISVKEEIYNIACFHAQQACEKTIKAFLFNKYEKVTKSHDLNNLVGKDSELNTILNDYAEELELLDAFYIPSRYPDVIVGSLEDGLPHKQDAENAIEAAIKIVEEVKRHL